MSQKLYLDFVENQAFSFSRFSSLGLFLFLLGLTFAMYVTQQYQAINTEYNQLYAQLQQIKPANKATSNNVNLETIPAAELKQVRETVMELSMPWNQLLIALEQTDMHDVALLSLEPSRKKQQVVLRGQAKNMQAALNYIGQLEKLPMLSQIYLQKHNVEQVDPYKPVSFTIVALWL